MCRFIVHTGSAWSWTYMFDLLFNLKVYKYTYYTYIILGPVVRGTVNKTILLNVVSVIIYTFDLKLLVLNYKVGLHYKLL